MTAPTQELTDSDIVKLRADLITARPGEGIVKNPPVFSQQGGGGGADRPTSGILYP